MKKTILFTLIILGLNFFLLFFPILFFFLTLSLSQTRFIDTFFWVFTPLLLFSPFLTTVFCIHLIHIEPFRHPWAGPLAVCLVGYIPFWLAGYFLSLCWYPGDYLWLALFPLLPGGVAYFTTWLYRQISKVPPAGRRRISA